MEEVPMFHEHPLTPFTRFVFGRCGACCSYGDAASFIYGGYRCNVLGCVAEFHKECVEALPEIIHSSHPDHPLKLIPIAVKYRLRCSLCRAYPPKVVYCCSVCDFYLDLKCARRPIPLFLPENLYKHEHPLQLSFGDPSHRLKSYWGMCKVCHSIIQVSDCGYRCQQCKFSIHLGCVKAYHTSHPKHPLKSLKCARDDAYEKYCLLCGMEFRYLAKIHHCDVCHFRICERCMQSQPPLCVVSSKTHEHQLHLVPRRIKFTCDACGTEGDQSPYFCLECNFMIHPQCIDLPRVININRHDHRVSYTLRLGRGELKCRVCRKKVDGIYGAYSCSKCSDIVVHLRCATKRDVWDMVELEGTPEEEEIAPFEVIGDDNTTIKHVSHDHNLQLQINKDVMNLPEITLCKACALQICSEPSFYSCKQCEFFLHEKCANLPLKKRHVCYNLPFMLSTYSHHEMICCELCREYFSGFRYQSAGSVILDVRCGSMTDSVVHRSHAHPLYYTKDVFPYKLCSTCSERIANFSCDECEFSLCYRCATLPQKVMRHRYDDHLLFLSYGERNVDGEYWCEACETKLNPKKWFYTCKHCGVVLHISCVVGAFSYVLPVTPSSQNFPCTEEVVSNTSVSRPLCCVCNSRCKLPTIHTYYYQGRFRLYTCSDKCHHNRFEIDKARSKEMYNE